MNALKWLGESTYGLVIYYENLKYNLQEEIRKILKYLHWKIDQQRINCTLQYPNGKFKRKTKKKHNHR